MSDTLAFLKDNIPGPCCQISLSDLLRATHLKSGRQNEQTPEPGYTQEHTTPFQFTEDTCNLLLKDREKLARHIVCQLEDIVPAVLNGVLEPTELHDLASASELRVHRPTKDSSKIILAGKECPVGQAAMTIMSMICPDQVLIGRTGGLSFRWNPSQKVNKFDNKDCSWTTCCLRYVIHGKLSDICCKQD